MTTLTRLALVAALAAPVTAVATVAHADDDIDVDSAEILEVVETADGSIWKGVIIELLPGTSIKIALSGGSVHVIQLSDIVRITRQKNPRRATATSTAAAGLARETSPRRVAPSYQPRPIGTIMAPAPAGRHLPAPFARSGMRLGVGLLVASPTGEWDEQQSNITTSYAPSIQFGYERLYGNFGLSGGGRVSWIYFINDKESKNAFWTLETHGYVRTALHLSKVSVYAGLSLGLDTNYSYFTSVRQRYLRVGLGFTIEGGADLAVTSAVSLGLAALFHPGTTAAAAPEVVPNDARPDVSHVGLRVGTTFRF